mgnify:CR=1 FL=1|tara:strand:- start:669 stop:2486 length:1818 start_codon:yes stop_codon:yes gene_type:complete
MKISHELAQTNTQPYRQNTNMTTGSTQIPSPYQDLTFPLNVYAHTQMLQDGVCDSLHYGLFQRKNNDFQTAQQYSTELLIAQLPPPPCRILEVGVGLGTTFALLTQQGYQVHGLTPDAQEVAYILKYFGEQVPVIWQQLEDFEAKTNSFDVILFQESAQHIEPLVIFNKAIDLLDTSGHLVIIDTFALKHGETVAEELYLLADMVTLAERFGFELVKQLDLSSMALPTLAYRIQTTNRHRRRLIKDLALSDQKLDQLNASNLAYQNKFTSGRYGYGLLHFKKKSFPKWRPGLLKKNQAIEMLSLFKKTFHHSMTPTTWQWKYGGALEREIGIWRGDQLIGHYGGISRNILFFSQPQIAVQIGDVMVDSTERGILTKKGPFFLMAATFLERYIGYGKPFLLGFGFPNERAMKVAERHGLYAEVGRMIEYSWKPLPKLPRWGTRLCTINCIEDEWTAAAIDTCWQKMAKDLCGAIVGVRDRHYLHHRYLSHPSQRYQVILVKNRFGERVRGILVLRHDLDGCEIIDIVAALTEIPLLVIHARRLAGIGGHSRVFCRITANFAAHFVTTGGICQELDIRIPTNVWSNGPSPHKINNCWWLMSGDTDFR